jgi:hypothetical protein
VTDGRRQIPGVGGENLTGGSGARTFHGSTLQSSQSRMILGERGWLRCDDLAPPSGARRILLRAMAPTTEILLASGAHHRVEGEASDIARVILDAARGSIMELAWVVDAETGERLGINPAMVVSLRGTSAG